jgi:hypothetical protein
MGMATKSTSSADSLEFHVQNNRGHQFRIRVFTGAVQFFYNGTWNTQFPYGGSTGILTEWWFDAKHNGGSNYTVRLFAGTQELPGFTGDVPRGTPGDDGWLGFTQYSAAVPNRKGRAAFLQVGSSTLPANMNLISIRQTVATEPAKISLALMYEDVSLQTSLNADLMAWISNDGGTTWHQVILANYGKRSSGVLDQTKPVYLAAGQVALPASGIRDVCCRVTSGNGRYFALHGYAWTVVA